MLCTFIGAAPAYAADAVILMSSGAALFFEAEEGIRSVLRVNMPTYIMDTARDPEDKKLIRKLRDENMDLLLVVGSPAMQVALKEFRQVPLVFCFVLDYSGIVSPLNEKGEVELSGVTMNISPDAQLKTLLEINPQVKRLGIVYDRQKSSEMLERVREAAKRLDIRIVDKGIDSNEQAVNAISEMKGEIDAYLMLPDSTVLTPETVKYLLLFSFKNQISLVGLSEKYVKQGALLSLSFDSKEMGKQAGELANDRLDKIKGSKARIVDPRTLRLSINKNTAEQLKIVIPDNVMKKAYQVY